MLGMLQASTSAAPARALLPDRHTQHEHAIKSPRRSGMWCAAMLTLAEVVHLEKA